jgi:hypothetical protein
MTRRFRWGCCSIAAAAWGPNSRSSREAVAQFFKTANPEDEAFLVQFHDTAEPGARLHQQPGGDSEPPAVHPVQGNDRAARCHLPGHPRDEKGHNPRKALLIISDGGDNNSRYTESEIRNLVKEVRRPVICDRHLRAHELAQPHGGREQRPGPPDGIGRARRGDANTRWKTSANCRISPLRSEWNCAISTYSVIRR